MAKEASVKSLEADHAKRAEQVAALDAAHEARAKVLMARKKK